MKNPNAVALGKLGGEKGGRVRAEKLSPEELSAIAQKGAQARWNQQSTQKRETMDNKLNKYFCDKCQSLKLPKIVVVHPFLDQLNGEKTPQNREVIKIFKNKKLNRKTGQFEEKHSEARQLDCGHFIMSYMPALPDSSLDSDSLTPEETFELRKQIDKDMLGKNKEETESKILFHAHQYQTLLKISQKQTKQHKYRLQYLDQLKEKFASQLSTEKEKQAFNQKFSHFLNLPPITQGSIETERRRERSNSNGSGVEDIKERQKLAAEKVKAMLAKTGYKLKDILGEENK